MLEHKEHSVGQNEIELGIKDLVEVEVLPSAVHTDEVKALEEELRVSPLSPLELAIAEEKLNNVSHKAIGLRLGVSDKIVRVVLSRTHVKKYIKNVFDTVTAAEKDMRMQVMASIIENKMEQEGVTSKLDLAQLIQILDSMGKVKETSDIGGQSNVMINILNSISKD